MKIEIREDSVLISGYVNAVERLSKPITENLYGKMRTFLERIKAGVFRKALKRNDNVLVLLNHDKNRQLASTGDGTAKLEEDNIGLRAEITITDEEVCEKARAGLLSGWSFGFRANDDDLTQFGDDEVRTVTDLDLVEVSILDDTCSPAYYGTSIEARGEGTEKVEVRAESFVQIEKSAMDEHEAVWKKAEAQHEAIEQQKEEAKMNMLAELIASKIVEAIKAGQEEEKEPDEQELEIMACKSDKDNKKRSVDYSKYEDRINQLRK